MQTNLANAVSIIGDIAILLALIVSLYSLLMTLLEAKSEGSYAAYKVAIAKDTIWVFLVLGIAIFLYDFF